MTRNKIISGIFARLKKQGLERDDLRAITLACTDQRTNSLKLCSDAELISISRALHGADPDKDRMRKKVIGLLRECGYEQWNDEKRKMVADMPRIYAFVQSKGVHNPLHMNQYDRGQLAELVSQVEQTHKKEHWKNGKKT